MALEHEIQSDIKAGLLPARFTVDDLLSRPEQPGCYRIGNATYAESTLRTHPNNRGISIDGLVRGNHVEKGQTPLFHRFGNATFSLIESGDCTQAVEPEWIGCSEGEGEALLNDPLPEPAPSIVYAPVDSVDPAEIIVKTIAASPFQAYFKKSRKLHPVPAATGWAARLEAYFWPVPQNNWANTRLCIDEFTRRFRLIEDRKSQGIDDTFELLCLFEEICAWGGVKLPESDQNELFAEVFDTLSVIDQNGCPGKASRINSAWTKLYAVARPESFVIFDSRVATSLISILDPYMLDLSSKSSFSIIKDLGTVQGRGGSRPRPYQWNWPVGYQSWKSQIAANSLCTSVVNALNQSSAVNGDRRWVLREVEAVLFMDGY